MLLAIGNQRYTGVSSEDRTGSMDRVQVARVNPETGMAAFSEAVPGHKPVIAAGEENWAIVSFQANRTDANAQKPTVLMTVLVTVADP